MRIIATKLCNSIDWNYAAKNALQSTRQNAFYIIWQILATRLDQYPRSMALKTIMPRQSQQQK